MQIKIAISVATLLVTQNLLMAKSTVLGDVTVSTASGYEQNIVDAPASITIVTKEELEGKAYFDVSEALRDIPGVSIEGGGSGSRGKGMGSFSISIRGMSSDYTLLLVDGKAQGNSGQVYYNGEGSGQEIGWLPPLSSIEKIEVVRGPMSSLYGSQALGGVINIITKKVLNEFTGSISAQRVIQENSNSGNEQQYNYFFTGPIIKDKLGFSVNGAYTKRDEDKIQYGYRENIRKNITGKLDWIVNEKNDLNFEYGYFEQDAEGTVTGVGTDTEKEATKKVYGITHDYSWDESTSTKTYIQHEDMDNEFQNGGTEYVQTILNSKTVVPFDTNKMTLGLEYKEEETDHGTRGKNVKNLARWSGALFLEDEYYISDDFSVTAGARWNEDEKYGGELTPRLYGIYKLSENFTLKGGISSGYVTPNLKQGDSQWVEGGFGGSTDGADIGNDDLTPEKSLSYEIGLIYDNQENLNLSLTTYKTNFEDKIQKSTICDRRSSSSTGETQCVYLGYDYEAISEYNNADEAELEGFEVSGSYIISALTLNANYTYSKSEITKGSNAGDPLNNYPKHMVNLGLDYKANADLKFWSKIKYKGKTLSEETTQTPGYTIADAGINYDLSKNLALSIGVYNLLDKEITYEKYSKILDGRKYAMGMKYSF